MVALDDRARPLEGHALDHVGVERALDQEFRAADLGGFAIEDVDEDAADDLPLLFRIGDARERGQELLSRVDVHQVQVEVVAEHADDFLGLVLSEHAVVDEDAGELVADGFRDQHRRDRRVDPAREAANDLGVADLLADLGRPSLR